MIDRPKIILRIDDLAYGGDGVGRLDGRAIFVPGALPGELVEAEILMDKGRFARARCVKILEPSPCRARPPCPLALDCAAAARPACAGCQYQHLPYEQEVEWKNTQLRQLLTRLGKIPIPPSPSPVLPSPKPLGYRNKLTLHAGTAPDGAGRVLGFHGTDGRGLVDVPCCPLAIDPINGALTERRAEFSADSRRNREFDLTIRHTSENGVTSWTSLEKPPPGLLERIHGVVFDIPSTSFLQVNALLAEPMIDRVLSALDGLERRPLLDLCCGVGFFAIPAAMKGFQNVLGVDTDAQAVRAAIRTAKRLSLDACRFHAADAAETLAKLPKEFAERPALLVDPPRGGLSQETPAAFAALRPTRIVYVSCAADTLARDTARLAASGFRLVRTELLDLFPRTAQFECVAVFE